MQRGCHYKMLGSIYLFIIFLVQRGTSFIYKHGKQNVKMITINSNKRLQLFSETKFRSFILVAITWAKKTQRCRKRRKKGSKGKERNKHRRRSDVSRQKAIPCSLTLDEIFESYQIWPNISTMNTRFLKRRRFGLLS